MVSVADEKGKLVLVGVDATYCVVDEVDTTGTTVNDQFLQQAIEDAKSTVKQEPMVATNNDRTDSEDGDSEEDDDDDEDEEEDEDEDRLQSERENEITESSIRIRQQTEPSTSSPDENSQAHPTSDSEDSRTSSDSQNNKAGPSTALENSKARPSLDSESSRMNPTSPSTNNITDFSSSTSSKPVYDNILTITPSTSKSFAHSLTNSSLLRAALQRQPMGLRELSKAYINKVQAEKARAEKTQAEKNPTDKPQPSKQRAQNVTVSSQDIDATSESVAIIDSATGKIVVGPVIRRKPKPKSGPKSAEGSETAANDSGDAEEEEGEGGESKRMRSRDKPYQCGVCQRWFGCKSHVVEHMRTHTGEKPFECPLCHRRFSQKSNIYQHMNTHTQQRPFRCNDCGKDFMYRGSLYKHKRLHTGERPYTCGICQRRFTHASQLFEHLRTHTNERPFKCGVCGRAFAHSGTMHRHQRNHFSQSKAGRVSRIKSLTMNFSKLYTKGDINHNSKSYTSQMDVQMSSDKAQTENSLDKTHNENSSDKVPNENSSDKAQNENGLDNAQKENFVNNLQNKNLPSESESSVEKDVSSVTTTTSQPISFLKQTLLSSPMVSLPRMTTSPSLKPSSPSQLSEVNVSPSGGSSPSVSSSSVTNSLPMPPTNSLSPGVQPSQSLSMLQTYLTSPSVPLPSFASVSSSVPSHSSKSVSLSVQTLENWSSLSASVQSSLVKSVADIVFSSKTSSGSASDKQSADGKSSPSSLAQIKTTSSVNIPNIIASSPTSYSASDNSDANPVTPSLQPSASKKSPSKRKSDAPEGEPGQKPKRTRRETPDLKVFICDICGLGFCHRRSVKRHKIARHQEEGVTSGEGESKSGDGDEKETDSETTDGNNATNKSTDSKSKNTGSKTTDNKRKSTGGKSPAKAKNTDNKTSPSSSCNDQSEIDTADAATRLANTSLLKSLLSLTAASKRPPSLEDLQTIGLLPPDASKASASLQLIAQLCGSGMESQSETQITPTSSSTVSDGSKSLLVSETVGTDINQNISKVSLKRSHELNPPSDINQNIPELGKKKKGEHISVENPEMSPNSPDYSNSVIVKLEPVDSMDA